MYCPKSWWMVALASFVAAGWSRPLRSQSGPYDLLIRGGRVLDGTGNPWFRADIGIRGDMIAAVGDLEGAPAGRVLEAGGMYITPGFVDMHQHSDQDILSGQGDLPNFTTQGFTTAVINQDGRTARWPIARQKIDLEKAGSALNLVMLVGHNTVRQMVMGDDHQRYATEAEIEKMKALVRQGMEEGAMGLSAGLEYIPGRWSHPDEVLALAKVIAPYKGFYIAHQRSQGQYAKWQLPSTAEKPADGIDAILETIRIAEEAGIKAVATHIHPKGPREWGTSHTITTLIDRARARGTEVYLDQHPYEGYDETIVLVPRWALLTRPIKGLGQFDSNNPEADYSQMREMLSRRLQDLRQARVIRRDIEYEILRQGGADGLLIMDYPDPSWIGKTLEQVSRERKEDPVDTALYMQMHGFDRPGGVQFRAFAVSMLDIEQFMRQDYTAVCTDRQGDTPELRRSRFVHPGTFGTAPRKIRHHVFERKAVSLAHAIRSLSSLAAQIIGLSDRGLLTPGKRADLVVFDPERIRDKATYFEPFQQSEGIPYVLVNGQLVVDGSQPTGARPGRVLLRQEASGASSSPEQR